MSYVYGSANNDILNGGLGNDILLGYGGNDAISGDAAADTLKGSGGDDTLYGGQGDDLLIGGKGSDALDGGEGSDEYRITTKDAGTTDIFADTGTAGTDTINATAVTTLDLGTSFDTSSGIEVIEGAATGLILAGTTTGVAWDFTAASLLNVTLIQGSTAADVITGSSGDDTIKGLAGDDQLYGGAGDDLLQAAGGNDKLFGGADVDVLKGGGGNDFLDGGSGADDLRSGKGDDTLVYDATDISINGQAGDADTLSLAGASGATLDITTLAGVTLKNIEVIDLDNGGNTLILDKASVNALSDTVDVLTVNGGASDLIIATDDEWTQLPDDGSYHVYSNGTTLLRILAGTETALINTPVNDDPFARDDTGATDEDSSFTTVNVLANDADADGDTVSISAVDATSVGGGLITDNGDGTFLYDPNGQFESLGAGETATDTFTYTISDGQGGTDTGQVTVTITGVNDAPVITSDGGNATASVNVAENSTVVTTVTATDVDLDTPTFTITGGADASLFSINTATGELTFINGPDREDPDDADTDNAYEVQVTASDGTLTDTQDITVNVTDVDEFDVSTPVDGNGAANAVTENVAAGTLVGVTASATDADATTNGVTYSLTSNPGG